MTVVPCLQSLVAETTNNKWRETQINGKAKTIYKLVRFSKFSLYWQPEDEVQVGEQGNTNWRLAMRDILEAAIQGRNSEQGKTLGNLEGLNHQTVSPALLVPLCGRMKIMMNRSVKDGSPRLLFDYVLKDVRLTIGKPQYHAMMTVQSALKFLELAR